MLMRLIMWCSKALAATVLFIAFPPIFRLGKIQGLLISFGLMIFYFFKGFIFLLVDPNNSSGRMKEWNKTFNILELPAFFLAVYISGSLFPSWMAKPYEWFLVCSNPLFIVFEGLCIISLIVLGGIFLMCSLVVGSLYFSPNISLTAATATLIGSSMSCCMILVIVSMFHEQGCVLDAVMLYMYVTYNIWINSKSVNSSFIKNNREYPLNITSLLYVILPHSGVISSISTFLNLFSIEIISNILLKIVVFIGAAKFLERIKRQSDDEISFDDEVTYNDLLLAFGKSILIMIYTYSWLQQIDPHVGSTMYIWRWINIYVTMGMYARNLFYEIEFDPYE